MSSTYPRNCARCGKGKPPWFQYCGDCYAIVQIERLEPNTCGEQDCEEEIKDEHFLCGTHHGQYRVEKITECPQCGEYKPSQYPLCRRCNAESTSIPQQRQESRPRPEFPRKEPESNIRRPYEQHDGADDQKAKDKRYWFNHQNNGICNYCGHRYPYDQLEMEHMIPKELGGPDHRRNMQLACQSCNQKKGTSTDIEFRELNREFIPVEERTPPKRPVDPQKLKQGTQGERYREPSSRRPDSGTRRQTAPRSTPRRRGS